VAVQTDKSIQWRSKLDIHRNVQNSSKLYSFMYQTGNRIAP